MLEKDYLAWVEKIGLLDIARLDCGIFKNVLKNCLRVKKEKVLIIGDKGYSHHYLSPLTSLCYYLAAKEMKLDIDIIIQEPKKRGDSAEPAVVNALENLKENSILILPLSYRLGSIKALGSSYRKFALSMGYRFASTTSLGGLRTSECSYLFNAINVNYPELQKNGKHIKEILDDADEIRVKSPVGTDMYYRVKGKEAISNTGLYGVPSSGGNIPAGEVYIPPRGKKRVNGTIVIDASMSTIHGTYLLNNPVKLTVEQGVIVDIEGGKEAKILQESLDWADEHAKFKWGNHRIGELGIGINPKAEIVGSTIIDEKVIGSAHFAIGSNAWFGGTIYSIIHLDQVFRNAQIFVDDKPLNQHL